MLKHVLETKHSEEGFKCAVIVNDMATLNIDKSLIDQSALVQTDEVNYYHSLLQCKVQNDLQKSFQHLQFVIRLNPRQIEFCFLEKQIICFWCLIGTSLYFLTFPADFEIPIIFSNLYYNCSIF